ncbi:hypothetical protein [Sphingomonas sp. G-3-2-10]|uniref:hypothetical protein n=1 Tax=Sphingomonas sp. G-3-2-10 TaxID=2728838 RepID=UPI00146F62C5|nr:hypothetical protein [Sphingomonas sp. G-3-2-10]NML05542.1 hypothetical protein [Sphingomonas sp. G-3-2-10]
MIRILFAAAGLTIAFAAPAYAQDGKTSFVRDGVDYSYTTKKVGQITVIEGRTSPGGEFRLEVRDGRVRGTMNSQPVSFTVPVRKPAAGQVASTR